MGIVHRALRAALMAAALGLLAACGGGTAVPVAGSPAPDFSLPQLGGSTVRLAEQRGKVVIVNFWASWCGPCESETPRLVQWYEAHRAAGLMVLGVDSLYLDSRDSVERFAQQYKVRYPVLLDGEGKISKQWRAQQLPRSYVVDRKGVVRFTRIGEITESDWQTEVQPLLAGG